MRDYTTMPVRPAIILKATATAAKVGTTVTASINGTVVTVQVLRDLPVAAGDVLLVQRMGSEWFAIGRAYPSPPATPANDTAPDPKPSTVSGRLVVPPVSTGSYRASTSTWRTDTEDIIQGSYGGYGNHFGAAFYGNLPRSLDGATVTSAKAQIRRQVGGSPGPLATTLALFAESSRPAGAPTVLATTPGPAMATGDLRLSVEILTTWAQQIVDGTAGGIGVYDADGTPYVRLSGRGSWSPAFTLTLFWTRS